MQLRHVDVQHTLSSYWGAPNRSYFRIDIGLTRTNDLLSTTSTSYDTSNPELTTRVDNEEREENKENKQVEEINNDPIEEVSPDVLKIAVIS